MSGRLRCWPGARAMAVRSTHPENRRTVVTCIRLATRAELDAAFFVTDDGPVWLIDRPLVTTQGNLKCFARDKSLTPLTPPPGAESTTTDAAQPVEAA